MKYNKIYSSILRSEWALVPDAWNSYSVFLRHLANGSLEGMFPDDNLNPEMVISYIDDQGRNYRASKDRPVEDGSILVLDVIGVMTKYGGLCHYGTTELAQYLAQNLSRPEVIGAVVRTDSGGGAVNAIAPLAHLIESSSKPIVALCDTAGSAAYWLASSCDWIIAENNISAGFGSVGVVITLADMKPKLEKEGIVFHTVYAPESEHKNQAFELMLEGKYDLIQREMLSPLALRFQNHVRDRRGSKLQSNASGVLTGKMFFAEQAKELGLVDEIGSLESAVEKVRSLSSMQELRQSLS